MRDPDLSLDLCLVSRFSAQMEISRLAKLDDLVRRLEDERKKIEAFKRELPFCMLLLNDAIFRLKQRAVTTECAENKLLILGKEDGESNTRKNSLNSFQMWIPPPNDVITFAPRKERNSDATPSNKIANARATEIKRAGNGSKKPRRCWSPELHRRFVSALETLGGSNGMQVKLFCLCGGRRKNSAPSCVHAAATPKQIRELMKVDGLSNDEVKSHLQKYRLYIQKHRCSPAFPRKADRN